jgi:hypothetical protein
MQPYMWPCCLVDKHTLCASLVLYDRDKGLQNHAVQLIQFTVKHIYKHVNYTCLHLYKAVQKYNKSYCT